MKIVRIVLGVVFLWSLAKTLELLVREASIDRLVFEGSGLPWLFWLFLVPLAALQAAAVYFVVRPTSTPAYRMAQAAVVLGAIETVTATALTFGNPELLRHAIIASRTERGLPIREEVIRLAESSAAQIFPLVIGIGLACLWLSLLAKLRGRGIEREVARP